MKNEILHEEDEINLQEKPSHLEETDDFNNSIPILEQIINKYGYGFKTWEMIILCFVLILINGLVMYHFNCIVIPFQSLHKLTNFETQIISSILFVGVALGSYLSGLSANNIGRVNTLKIFTCAILITYLAIAWISNVSLIGILRFFIGVFNGINLVIGYNMMIENLPTKLRGFTSQVVWIGYPLSVSILLFIMLGIMPNLETNKLSIVLSYSSIIIIISLIYVFIYARDSPRNLILEEKYQEAFNYLELLHGKKIELDLRNKIIHQINSGNNETRNISEIFNKNYLLTTILLMFIFLISASNFYGLGVIFGNTVKDLKLENDQSTSNKSIIIGYIIQMLLNILGNFISGLLTEFQFLGRRYSMLIGFIIEALFHILIFFFPTYFSLFTGIAVAANSLPFNIATVYTSEFYPTRIRDYALGYMFVICRIGGFISQFIFVELHRLHYFAPYYLATFLSVVGSILIMLLSSETYDRSLDVKNVNFREENKNQ